MGNAQREERGVLVAQSERQLEGEVAALLRHLHHQRTAQRRRRAPHAHAHRRQELRELRCVKVSKRVNKIN